MAVSQPCNKGRLAAPSAPFYERVAPHLHRHVPFIQAYIREGPRAAAASGFRHRDAIGRPAIGQHAHDRHTAGGPRERAERNGSFSPEQSDARGTPAVSMMEASPVSPKLSRHSAFFPRKKQKNHCALIRTGDWMPVSCFDRRAWPLAPNGHMLTK